MRPIAEGQNQRLELKGHEALAAAAFGFDDGADLAALALERHDARLVGRDHHPVGGSAGAADVYPSRLVVHAARAHDGDGHSQGRRWPTGGSGVSGMSKGQYAKGNGLCAEKEQGAAWVSHLRKSS